MGDVNNFDSRKKKVQEFEVHIDATHDDKTSMRDLTSYSEGAREKLNMSAKKGLRNFKRVRKSPKNAKFFRSVWLFMIAMICLMLGQLVVFGTLDMLAITREDAVVSIEIPKGAGKNEVANILYKNNVIKQPSFFKLYMLFTKGSKKFIPGSFEIKTNLDYEAAINYLRSNANRLDSDVVDVMIPEGKNVMEIASILEKNEICSEGEFLKACKSSEFDKEFNFLKETKTSGVIYRLEGYLFPDTYTFYKNVEPRTVINKMLNNFNNKVNKKLIIDDSNEKVSVKTLAERKSMQLADVINLAAMVQAEASNDADMHGIAAVINNRLHTSKTGGMSSFGDAINGCLGVDATVWYPYRSRDKVPQNMVDSYESPYDTYKFSGLPKGAICNPGMTAIETVLNHKPTQNYFYCHDKDGNTYYAKTFAEHSTNLRKAGLK